ncbi:hypothetical protein ACF0H5_007729 [Mactra antiquata]
MNKLIIFSICIAVVMAHPEYQQQIPNGAAVPDPCNPGSIWLAVGHYKPTQHTQQKNPFGQDFIASGHVWTTSLCQADSDGDGATNGEELGDPNCVWTVGATPEQNATGHPGICNPLGSCSMEKFTCGCEGFACVFGK